MIDNSNDKPMGVELIEQLKLAISALERCEYGAARIRLKRILAGY